MRLHFLLLLLPAISFAQSQLVTEFPADAVTLSGDAIKTRFSDKSFAFTDAKSVQIQMQFQDANIQVSTPSVSDTGQWRAEGSSICINFSKFKSGCNEVRVAGDVLYWKRNSNGEVVRLVQK